MHILESHMHKLQSLKFNKKHIDDIIDRTVELEKALPSLQIRYDHNYIDFDSNLRKRISDNKIRQKKLEAENLAKET